MHRKTNILLYGIFSYVVGMAGLVWFLLYVGGWDFLPQHINSKAADVWLPAVLINFALVVLFSIQHSVMARPWFKKAMEKAIPPAAERSGYVLVSGILMALFCLFWQPVPGVVWWVENPLLVYCLRAVHIAGWLVLVGATFEIDHFELMGLKQVWRHYQGKPWSGSAFTEKFFYKIVRHPIQLGLLMVVWTNPHMSKTLYLLAGLLTVYIHIGLCFEERALLKAHGETYRDYMRRVPRLLPAGKLFTRHCNKQSSIEH